MSRILRRPMFRGGRVSAYGTGIASGLADGGRVGYYNGELVTGTDLLWKNRGGQKIYGSSSPYGIKPKITDLVTGYGANQNWGTPPGDEDPLAHLQYLYASGDDPTSEDVDVFSKQWVNEDLVQKNIDKETWKTEQKTKKEENPDYQPIEFETWQGIKKEIEADEPDLGLGGSEGKQILKAEKEPGKELEFTGIEGADPSDYDSSDLESMISRYEDLLGGKKAKRQDFSDMLLGFAGKALKPEATVKGAFGEFFEEEAKKGPGRGEKIKQAAAMLGIKGEQAQKLYETKLKNVKGMFTKKVEEIMGTEGVTRSEAIRMALGQPGSLGEAYLVFKQKTGMPPTPQEFDMMAEGYTLGPLPEDWQTSKPTGTYYIPNEMVIVEMVEGVAKSKKPYKPQ